MPWSQSHQSCVCMLMASCSVSRSDKQDHANNTSIFPCNMTKQDSITIWRPSESDHGLISKIMCLGPSTARSHSQEVTAYLLVGQNPQLLLNGSQSIPQPAVVFFQTLPAQLLIAGLDPQGLL